MSAPHHPQPHGLVRNVGIRGIQLHFPAQMVRQQELEGADGCPGKYTQGLGQAAMAFCGDREDVVSMAATAVLALLEGAGVALTDIGRLDVGTETGVDRSKSVMSYLVSHFADAGNTTLQGSDHMHGCYAGTAALFSVADWVCGPSWDGRLGLVVATDIAVYPPGSPARPTGGCGAAALLVGPDAPLVLEGWPWRASFAAHAYDFFKPHGHPLYPLVDGPATTLWFTKAADACAAQLYSQLAQAGVLLPVTRSQPSRRTSSPGGDTQQQQQQVSVTPCGLLSCFDYFLSHAPYAKIVAKVFARLVLHDGLRALEDSQQQQQVEQQQEQPPGQQQQSSRLQLLQLPPEAAGLDVSAPLPDSSITDKALERVLLAASRPLHEAMVAPGGALQAELGNLYTASLYSGLASLLSQQGSALAGKRVLCFSYGSGVVASMFALTGRAGDTASGSGGSGDGSSCGVGSASRCGCGARQRAWRQAECSLQHMADQLRLPERLAARRACSVSDFDEAMASLRSAYDAAPYSPSYGSLDQLQPGSVFLQAIDAGFRRLYGRRPHGSDD